MKDNFSSESGQYASYRPTYPAEFFDFLFSLLPVRQRAWDCGTGTGQVAFDLAKKFEQVYATDISQSQLDNATQKQNIRYSRQPAEATNFDDQEFDLVIAAQAVHWFDLDRFYAEVRRMAKENALLCIIGYGRLEVSQSIDLLITDFYKNVIGPYWDKERRYIDEHYKTIPFPFDEVPVPAFSNAHSWTRAHLMGYLNTWSAVKHYVAKNGFSPVDNLERELKQYWADGERKLVTFPLLVRLGRVNLNAGSNDRV